LRKGETADAEVVGESGAIGANLLAANPVMPVALKIVQKYGFVWEKLEMLPEVPLRFRG